MSDGPYRSLNMRPGWKALAKRGQMAAFDADDVADAVCPALEGDWSAEISREFMVELRAFCDLRQGSLFDETGEALNRLRRLGFAHGTLGMAAADFAVQARQEGLHGAAALRSAIERTLFDRATCNVRGVEEHYHRESTAYRAQFVRSRLESGVQNAAARIAAMAERLAGGQPLGRSAPAKQTGLDDGASLP